MLAESILQRLEAEFDSPPETIRAVATQLAQGANPEFVALYQRDETGDPGEERIAQIAERLHTLQEIETRRESVLSHASEEGRTDVEELRALLADTVDQDLLDDVDHQVRSHAASTEAAVRELGLGELLDALLRGDLGEATPRQAAERHVRDQDGLRTPDEVLAQVVLALAQRFGEDPRLRQRLRAELSRGILAAIAIGQDGEPVAPAAAAAPDRRAEPQPASEEQATPEQATPEQATPAERADEGDVAPPASAEKPAEAQPDADQPTADQPTAGQQATGEPATEPPPEAAGPTETPPATEQPSAQAPADEAAAAAAPASEQPDAARDAADQPPSDQPAVEQPAVDQPAVEQPAAEQPAEEPAPEHDAAAAADAGSTAAPSAAAPSTAPAARSGRRGKGGRKGPGARYEDLVGLREPVRRVSSSRMLALRRAEREGILRLQLELEPGRELEIFRQRFSPEVDPATPLGSFLDLVYGHAYDQGVHRACEQIVRHRMKEKADRETVRTFARSLRSQLMAPSMLGARVAALRVSGRSAWFVTLNPDGSPKQKMTLPVSDQPGEREQLLGALREALQGDEAPHAVAIPHGKRERAAARLLGEVLAGLDGPRPQVVPVDETASIVWATSASARKRHSSSDSGLRTTLSLARRLRDPLAELIRVEPRGLGLGQHLTEVHQGILRRQLDATAASCLARIGVDVNRADQPLLARLPGVSNTLARAIVQHRSANGPLQTLADLRQVEGVDDAVFRHVAGFLRIHGGTQPLDETSIHPEDYPLVERIGELLGKPVTELLGKPLERRVEVGELGDQVGPLALRDIVQALRRGATDPRGRIETFDNQGVNRFEDLALDAELRGRVTNLAEFGAFIDLGIGQDGLVHVSQIPGSRLRDPARVLRVGEIVHVYVVHLDPKGRKIGLSMVKPRHLAEGRPATLGERMGGGQRRGGRGGRKRSETGGRREEPETMGRAARAPEGRRTGGRRGGPRPKPVGGGGGGGGGGGDGPRRGGRPGGGRGDSDRRGPRGGAPGGKPRVMTFESDREEREVRGHKGELRSLANLRALLGEQGDAGERDRDDETRGE